MSTAPELGQRLYRSAEATVLRDRIADYAVPHQVEPLAGDLAGVVTGVDLGGVSLAFVKYGAVTRVVAEATGSQLCWTAPIGPMQVILADQAMTLREGFLLDTEQATVMVPDPRRGAVVVTTTTAAAREHLSALLGRGAPQVRAPAGPAPAALAGQLELAWRYVAASLLRTPDPPQVLRQSLAQTLLTALLLEMPASAGLLHQQRTPKVRHLHVRRAVEWAAQNYTKPVRISDWAQGLAISIRHLQTAIRSEFGCTPMEYLRNLRLARAHRMLQHAYPEQTVTTIATLSGFTHLGRFAEAYRRAYGVSPHQSRGNS